MSTKTAREESTVVEPDSLTPGPDSGKTVEKIHTDNESGSTPPKRTGRGKRIVRMVVATLVGAACLTVFVVQLRQYLDERQMSSARDDVAAIASQGVTSALSYKADSVDGDLTKAADTMTGEFLDYYTKFTKDIVAPAAKEKNINTTANVIGSAVVTVSDSNAEVLLFVNQSTTSSASPNPSQSASSVRVKLERTDSKWLINSFEPL